MKYEFMKKHCSTFQVEKMAKVLKVSRSSYYSWKKRGKSKRRKENEILLVHIKNIYYTHKGNYGSPRITSELEDMNIECGHNRVAKLMKENNIVAKTKKKYKSTTKSKHDKPVAPDLLNKNFSAPEKNQIWTSDITYIWTKEGWLYLAVVLDIFSRKIVGWALEKYLKKELVTKALLRALSERRPEYGLIFHSDRGVQYASIEVRDILSDNEILQSMSEKGNCYGNAITESFFHTLKGEHICWETYETREVARMSIFKYIEMYYNRKRKHSSIGYMSPEKFEQSVYGVDEQVA